MTLPVTAPPEEPTPTPEAPQVPQVTYAPDWPQATVALNPAWSSQPQQAVLMMIGVPMTAAAGTTLIRVWAWAGWMVDWQMPPSRGHANDACAPEALQLVAPVPQPAEHDGQNVQLAPGYSGNCFVRAPSQS